MQKSKTQIGFLGFVEKFVRKFVTIYYFIRSIAIKFDIFEEDFKILRKIFNNKKIKKISKLLSKYGYQRYYNNNGNLEIYTNQKVLDIFFIVKK